MDSRSTGSQAVDDRPRCGPRTDQLASAPVPPQRGRTALALALAAVTLTSLGCGAAKAPSLLAPKVGGAPVPALAQGALALAQTTPLATRIGDPSLPAAHAVWLAMLAAAQHRVDIAQFYIANRPGSRLDRVLGAIEAAAARGVVVRILVDVRFAKKYPASLARLDAHRGISVRRLDAGRHLGGGVLHAKYFVVDDDDAWLGSQNFDWRSLSHIHELGVRFRAPALVARLRACFACDWRLAASTSAPGAPAAAAPACGGGAAPGDNPTAGADALGFVQGTFAGQPVRAALVASPRGHLPPGVAWDLPALVELIDQAKRRVRVQLLSLHLRGRKGEPFPQLTDALRRAAGRGVQVQLLIAHWSQSPRRVAELATLHRVPGITVRFLQVPTHPAGFVPFARVIHSKYMIVDSSSSWVGTSNWGYGYFFTSRNVGLVVKGAPMAAQLNALFDRLWRSQHAADLSPGKRYPRPRIAR